MTEIFISYSRRNKSFAERFLKALYENGYSSDTVWIDWEDIPPSSKWEDEIRKGIEKTNSVIFILSPDWVVSRECEKELEVALEYNKRLFPIIWQNVDPNTIRPELASLNWIFFRETDDFDEALQKLFAAVKTDLGWVAQHTDLLSRSNEWNSKKRDNGYLLRGSELQSAETWLSQASDNKQPRPTPLQNEYIFASRQDDLRRQRRTLIGVSIAMVVSIGLAIAAVISGINALQQSQKALASQLAAQSTNLVNTQPDLSLLLSLEANYIGDELRTTDPGWLGSLVTSLNSSPMLGTYLRVHDKNGNVPDPAPAVRAVAFSSDGHWLASTGNSIDKTGTVALWDMTSTVSPIPYQKFTGGTQRFLGVAFSPDGHHFAAAGDESKIFVWDPHNCCTPTSEWTVDSTGKTQIRALSFVKSNGREYVAIASGSEVTFWDSVSGKQEASLTLQIPTEDKSVRVLSLAVSPDNNSLAVGSDDGNITVWDLNTSQILLHACSYDNGPTSDQTICHASGQGNTDIRGIAFTADSKQLITGSSDDHAWLWDIGTGKMLARSADGNAGGHLNTIAGISINPKDGRVATVSWDNTVRIWELVKIGSDWSFNRISVLAGHSNSVWTAAYSPNGNWLATGSSDATVILWKVNQTSQIGTPLAQMNGDVWALAVSPDKKHFAAGDAAGSIRIWDVNGQTLKESTAFKLNHPGGVLTLAYSNDNKWLASAGYDKTIRVWNVQTGQEAWRIDNAHSDQIWAVMFSPDDKWLASASFDKTAKIWDTTSHQQAGKSLEHKQGVYALTFNHEGTHLFVAGYESDIYDWDLTDIASIPSPRLLTGHQAAVNLLAFNPIYPAVLASTSDDKTLRLWNVDTAAGDPTPPATGLNESMEAVTFSPDGARLASATNNKTVLLWEWQAEKCAKEWAPDICQPERLGIPLVGHQTAVENVVFLSDKLLISSSEDGQLIQWNLDKQYWYKRACSIVNRPLSDAEYSQYIEGKINVTLLNAVNWFSDVFSSSQAETPPSCI
jgi:WD40 repeat protein